VRFCLAWIVPTWILCELIATKLPHYVLPTYPAIALLTGAAVAEGGTVASAERRPRFARAILVIWLVVSAALVLAVAALPIVLEKSFDWIALAACAVVAACAWAVRAPLRARRHFAATAIIAAVALAFHGLAVGYVLPRVDSLWVSRGVAHLVERSRPCPHSIVAAVGYHEPSLVFLLGTATKLVGLRLAAEHLLADPACARALIPEEDEVSFAQILAESGVTPAKLGGVSGINYSKGRRVRLGLFAIESGH
jgi:4-amino-4-deoxy-L-arabinose transferase-like glycosyltransferase